MSSAYSRTRRRTLGRPAAVPILILLAATGLAALLGLQSASAANRGADESAGSRERQAEEFTACMRAHGVPDLPGITISEDGQVQLNAGAVHPILDTYQAAATACAPLLPEGTQLPDEPEPPTPPAPELDFTCSGDCPAAPEPPAPPR